MKRIISLIIAIFIVSSQVFAVNISDFKTTIKDGKLILIPKDTSLDKVTINNKTYNFFKEEKKEISIDNKTMVGFSYTTSESDFDFTIECNKTYANIVKFKKSNTYYILLIAKKEGKELITLKPGNKSKSKTYQTCKYTYSINNKKQFTKLEADGQLFTLLDYVQCSSMMNDESYLIIN